MTCPLTNRQVEIVRELSEGNRRKMIAYNFGVSLPSIHNWLKHARELSRTETDEQLVAKAIREGWIQ